MILVPLLNPKFATVPAAKSCELRVRGTSAGLAAAIFHQPGRVSSDCINDRGPRGDWGGVSASQSGPPAVWACAVRNTCVRLSSVRRAPVAKSLVQLFEQF